MRIELLTIAVATTLLAGCGSDESAESREPQATFFGVIVDAQESGYLMGLRPNEVDLSDGTTVRWEGENSAKVSGCRSDVYSGEPSIIGCPVYVWTDEAGLASRVFGASYLDPGTDGSTPLWAIPGELYRRSNDVAVMSTGQFEFNGDDSMIGLREDCGSTPWWEIDPESGAVLGFVGWGSALFDDPCAWNI